MDIDKERAEFAAYVNRFSDADATTKQLMWYAWEYRAQLSLSKPVVSRLTDDELHDLITKHHPKCAKGVKRFEVTDWWNFGVAVQLAMIAASPKPIDADKESLQGS